MSDLAQSFATGADSIVEAAKAQQQYRDIKQLPEIIKQAQADVTQNAQGTMSSLSAVGGFDAGSGTGAEPADLYSVYSKASQLAMKQGNEALSFTLGKKAQEYKDNEIQNKANDLKLKQQQLDEVYQNVKLAQSDDDLQTIIDTQATDPTGKMLLNRLMSSNLTFEQKKQRILDMTQSSKEDMEARRITSLADYRVQQLKLKQEHEANFNKWEALKLVSKGEAALIQSIRVKEQSDPPIPLNAQESAFLTYGPVAIRGNATSVPGVSDTGAPQQPKDSGYIAPESRPKGKPQATEPVDSSVVATLPNGAKLTAEMKALADKGVPITSGIRSAADQQRLWDESVKAGRPGKTKEGYPIAKPGTSGHENGDIDVSTSVTKEGRKALALAGYYQPNPEKDPVHWAKIPGLEAKAEPVETQTGSEEQVIKPGQSVAGMTFGKAKAPSSSAQDRSANVLEGVMQANRDLTAMTQLPSGARLSAVADLTAMHGSTFASQARKYYAATATSDDAELFQKLASGFEVAMATAIGGGYATSASKSRMESYAQQLPRAGQSIDSGVEFLIRARAELEAVQKAFNTRGGATKEQKRLMQEEIDKLKKAVPISLDQFLETRRRAKEAGIDTKSGGGGSSPRATTTTTTTTPSGASVSNW